MFDTSLFFLVTIAATLFVTDAARAQPTTDAPRISYWIGGGLGVGTFPNADKSNAGFSIADNLNATFQFGRNLVTLRTAAVEKLFGDDFYDYGLLYGRTLMQGELLVSLGVGIAYVDGQRSEGLFSDTKEVNSTIGLPLEIQFLVQPPFFLGVGIYGFANINKEENFFGATLSIQLGKWR